MRANATGSPSIIRVIGSATEARYQRQYNIGSHRSADIPTITRKSIRVLLTVIVLEFRPQDRSKTKQRQNYQEADKRDYH